MSNKNHPFHALHQVSGVLVAWPSHTFFSKNQRDPFMAASSSSSSFELNTHLLQSTSKRPFTRKSITVSFARINGVPRHEPLKVAYQGSPGAYSESAARTALPGCTTVPCRFFSDAIAAVEAGQADRAVVPVESTLEGTALRNYELLLRHDIRVVQEVSLYVHYCLLAMPGVQRGELRRAISHPVALAHCGRRLAELGLDGEAVDDTAGAAVELLRAGRLPGTAAIASSRAARLYGLDVVAQGIQDESWNVTRFLILSKDRHGHVQGMMHKEMIIKTSMVVGHHGDSLPVLLQVLSAFSSRNINLTKLEMNKAEGKGPVAILDCEGGGGGDLKEFPHVFYVDFEGSVEDQRVQDAIDEICRLSAFVRVLGSYAADPFVYDLN